MRPLYGTLFLASIFSASAFSGCSCSAGVIATGDAGEKTDGGGPRYDFATAQPDLAGADFAQALNPCGDTDPGCMTHPFGPPQMPFPLQADPMPDPNETDNGVDRDNMGYIGLSSSKSNFDFVYAANMYDWNVGTVSKISSKQVKEVARYFTVTCWSNKEGSRANCDGTNGCCSRDDFNRFQNVLNQQQPGPHQAVQTHDNHPSRTAVDFNGDVWVANRAFGGQSSVSKIANDMTECTDRNGTPGIQTSSDVNGDGVIDTDCNHNGVPDDVADVQKTPCANGKPQEFYGFDDECVLFTTNTDVNNQWGRPLALGRGGQQFGPADAWAGTFNNCHFFRIDGTTGLTKAEAKPPGVECYGAAVDGAGILWAPRVAQPNLYYFDTSNPANVGSARTSSLGGDAYGVSMDRDQNVWLGGYPSGNAYRYTPDRSNGFAKLGSGYWTKIVNPGGGAANPNNLNLNVGRGISADSRTMGDYWVWMGRHDNAIIRIPASKIPVPQGGDVQVDGTNAAMGFLAIPVAGSSPAGAGVDTDQNIWAIASGNSVATRIKVDMAGTPTLPNVAGCTNNNGCPNAAGDCCPLRFGNNPDPVPYTYSDFTGFGLRNFTNPQGNYDYVQVGCGMNETKWIGVTWDADVPANTKLTMRARSGTTPTPDMMNWGSWTGDYTTSPADLKAAPGPVMPNPNPYLQVEFDLSTMDKASTPKLKSFTIIYECGNKIG